MGQSVSSQCKPCGTADPTADTVKVDPTLLDPIEGPKAQRPALVEKEGAEQKEKENGEEEEEAEEEAEQRRQSEAEEKRLEVERLERERLRAEEQERRRLAEEVEAARKQARQAEEEAEAQRQRQEELERTIKAERVKVEQARADSAKERVEAAAAQKAVEDFLKARGFKQLGLPRKAFCGASVHPLHLAVEENNSELVQAMVRCGADLQQKNAGNKTPLEIAEKYNKNGSHGLVVAALRGGA